MYESVSCDDSHTIMWMSPHPTPSHIQISLCNLPHIPVTKCCLRSLMWISVYAKQSDTEIFLMYKSVSCDDSHTITRESERESRSLLQNIVSFIGLFCKRDLSF